MNKKCWPNAISSAQKFFDKKRYHPYINRLLRLFALFLFINTANLYAKEYNNDEAYRRWNLEPEYFNPGYRLQPYIEFHTNLLMLQGLTIDIIRDASYKYTPASAPYFAPLSGIAMGLFYHYFFTEPSISSIEAMGQASRQKSMGMNIQYFAPVTAAGSYDFTNTQTNYFSFAWQNVTDAFSKNLRSSYTFSNGQNRTHWTIQKQEALTAMGALNAPMYFSEYLSAELAGAHAHLMLFSGYLAGRLYIYEKLVSSNYRLQKVTDHYDLENIPFDYTEAANTALVCFLGSATTLSFADHLLNPRRWGKPVRPMIIRNYLMPDFYYYLNPQGPSVKVNFAYITKSISYPVSIEFITQGRKTFEIETGANIKSAKSDISTSLIWSSASSLDSSLGLKLYGSYNIYRTDSANWKIWALMIRYAPESLEALRRSPNVYGSTLDTFEWRAGLTLEY